MGDGNVKVLERLVESRSLFLQYEHAHRYPCDWRTKKPIILRAAKQWFVDLSSTADETKAALGHVQMIPAVSRARLEGMLDGRKEWCISRQRVWGVPLPIFYDVDTEEPLVEAATIDHVIGLVAEHGTDCWWSLPVEELLPPQYRFDACGRRFERGTETMDVWFDSGCSWAGALLPRYQQQVDPSAQYGQGPLADLYLEGSDQHRGWFNSSLLTCSALHGHAPYKAILTHGFVVDDQGKKMSKSIGNVIDPATILNGGQIMAAGGKKKAKIPAYGADVMRLWVASADFTKDMVIGADVLDKISGNLRKFRNVSRFLLGNLDGFDPRADAVPYSELSFLDRKMLRDVTAFVDATTEAYDQYQFVKVCQLLSNFLATETTFYLEWSKDVLYCSDAAGLDRRRRQTVLHHVLETLNVATAPIACFISEEVRSHMREIGVCSQQPSEGPSSVFHLPWPQVPEEWRDDAEGTTETRWQYLDAVRRPLNVMLDGCRQRQAIRSSLEIKAYVPLFLSSFI
jgi:isoleucyl-tRNA synthetase